MNDRSPHCHGGRREFSRLQPPPGGEQRLRAALRGVRRRTPVLPRLALLGPALLVLAVASLWLLPRQPSPVEQALAELQPPTVHAVGGAVLELPSTDERVRVFVVAARKAGE